MSRYALKAALRLPYPPGKKPMSEVSTPVPVESPNGIVILPQWAVRPLTVLSIVAGVVGPMLPSETWRAVAIAVVGMCAGLGIYSGGARK